MSEFFKHIVWVDLIFATFLSMCLFAIGIIFFIWGIQTYKLINVFWWLK